MGLTVKKRNGSIEQFNQDKITTAIQKAFVEVLGEHSENKAIIERITVQVVDKLTCTHKTPYNIEDIQDTVEDILIDMGYSSVAKAYIRYRYKREVARKMNTSLQERYNHLAEFVSGKDEESNKENSNKDTRILSTMRDYLAGFICREMADEIILPKDIAEAHKAGIIHFHDSDYSPMMPMSNCFSRETKFVTQYGLKSFKDFNENDKIQVLTPSGNFKEATVKKYGKQKLNMVIFKKGNSKPVKIFVTGNHRWLLDSGESTTELKIGDKLTKIQIPHAHSIQELEKMNPELSIYWCKGFLYGDGAKWSKNGSRIRLCGEKNSFKNIFLLNGFHVSSKVNDDIILASAKCPKETISNKWTTEQISLFIEGWLAADGSYRNNITTAKSIITIGKEADIDYFKRYSCVGNYHIIGEDDLTGQKTNYGARKISKTFRLYTSNHFQWTVQSIEKDVKEEEVWCLEVEDEHAFVLEHGIPTGNCCLINLEDMLQNGTVISGTKIEKPHSFHTACTITTQVIAQVASSQYGGCTFSLAHLAPFVDISRQNIKNEVLQSFNDDYEDNKEIVDKLVKNRLKKEISDGIQTIQYQLITLSTTNGQSPFVSIMMYLDEVPDGQIREDLAMLIEEVLKQRIKGVKNPQGVYVTPAFPKLLYTLDEDNTYEDSRYFYLTKLRAECSAKRLVPDYISAKKMKELKGDVYSCMGCRSFLTPDPINHKYYGRFNQGVVTLNLPDVALSSGGDSDKFWQIYEDRLELCHRALRVRHESLVGIKSDVAPVLWQYGALARLKEGEEITPLLYNNYSTLSLGYAGLYECIKYMTGENQIQPNGKKFGLEVMQKLNDKCEEWKAKENIAYSVYGSPIESTTFKFAKALQKRFGIVKGITDKKYVTNSYHITPSQHIDAFSKLDIEAEFQELSPGGRISYIETPNMEKNIPALIKVIQHIYETIMYAEINTMTSYCQKCGCTDIKMGDDLKFHCPNCGNDDFNKMNIALRICGYISTNPFNDGRAEDIHDRVYHLDPED